MAFPTISVDPWLVTVSVLAPLLLIFINLIVIAHYIHPDDAGGAKFPKFVVMFGMLFSECAVLLLPLDVGNKAGVVGCGYWNNDCGGLQLDFVWQMVYVLVAAFVVIILPYTVFYYEADDREGNKGERIWWTAAKYSLITSFVSILTLIISFVFLRQTFIPVESMSANSGSFRCLRPGSSDTDCSGSTPAAITAAMLCGDAGSCAKTASVLKMDVTFVIYLAALLSFVGWFLFVVYAAIGLIALPMDLVNGFIHRRKLLSDQGVARYKTVLQKRAAMLADMGQKLKEEWQEYEEESHSRYQRKKQEKLHQIQLNKFAVLVRVLEEEAEDLRMSSPGEFNNNNPLVPWVKLFFGFLSTLISILWISHIVVFVLLDAAPFLNDYLIWFDTWFPLFGTISVGGFAMYLLLAVTKGNFKFGVRFFIMKIHPMEAHKTFVNSMIFNLLLVMLCVLPVVQFCTQAFAGYARLTDADVIFGSQIKNMEFFRHFFDNNVFVYAMLVLCFLALIYFTFTPSERKRLLKEDKAHREDLATDREARLRRMQRRKDHE